MTKEQNKTDIRATPCNPFERKFDVAAGTLWNSLPAGLRNEQSLEAFKKGLKTHLFKIAFVK